MFRAAGANLPRPVTYFTKELAKWRAGPKTKNSFSYKFTDADRIKGGGAPVMKAPNAPTLQAAIDTMQVVCCRGEDQAEQCRLSVRCR
jgi:hypothetical protein